MHNLRQRSLILPIDMYAFKHINPLSYLDVQHISSNIRVLRLQKLIRKSLFLVILSPTAFLFPIIDYMSEIDP